MAQHDYNITNQTRTDFREDLNRALSAIKSNNSSNIAPESPIDGMQWYDPVTSVMSVYDGNNWIPMQSGYTNSETFYETGSWIRPSNVFKISLVLIGGIGTNNLEMIGSDTGIRKENVDVSKDALIKTVRTSDGSGGTEPIEHFFIEGYIGPSTTALNLEAKGGKGEGVYNCVKTSDNDYILTSGGVYIPGSKGEITTSLINVTSDLPFVVGIGGSITITY